MAEQAAKTKKLTPKQERFCREYVVDLNATQAAMRAGYSKKTAYSAGQRLLKNVEIQKRLSVLVKARQERTGEERQSMTDKTAKHPGGRPRKYESAEQMQVAIDAYFEDTEKLTVTGLAVHLGFTSRADLIRYEGYSEEFYYTLKRAKLRVEAYYEGHLVESGAGGPIFALKNFGWRDRVEADITSGGEPIQLPYVAINMPAGFKPEDVNGSG